SGERPVRPARRASGVGNRTAASRGTIRTDAFSPAVNPRRRLVCLPHSLPSENQCGGRRGGVERDGLETGLGGPGLIVGPPPGGSLFALEEHFRGEQEREGRAASVVVNDEVADDQRAAGLECTPELGEYRHVVLRPLLVGDVGVHRDVITG